MGRGSQEAGRKSAQGLPVKQKQLAKDSPKLNTAPSKTRERRSNATLTGLAGRGWSFLAILQSHSLFYSYYSSFVPHYLVSPSNIYLIHDNSDPILVIYGSL